jgi:hypothetical protein
MVRRIKVLIVEDQLEWSEALKQMYVKLVREFGAVANITVVKTSADADAELSTQEFDILSLDINLNERYPAATWRDLLNLAKMSCTAAIVVTGIAGDSKLSSESVNLSKEVADIFRTKDKTLVLGKMLGNKPSVIADTIKRFDLSGDQLAQLCNRPDINVSYFLQKAMNDSLYIIIPVNAFWNERNQFDQVARTLIRNIAVMFREDEEQNFYDELIDCIPRIHRLKSLASLAKIIGGITFAALGYIYFPIPAVGSLLGGGFLGYIIGGFVGLFLYRSLLVEIFARSIGHLAVTTYRLQMH